MPETFTNQTERNQSYKMAHEQLQGAIGELAAQLGYIYTKYDRQNLQEVRIGLNNVRLTLADLDHATQYLAAGESILAREITESIEF